MSQLALIGTLIMLALAIGKFAPSAGINLKPLMTFLSLFVILVGATLLLIDIRNGNASAYVFMGSAFVAFGVLKFREHNA